MSLNRIARVVALCVVVAAGNIMLAQPELNADCEYSCGRGGVYAGPWQNNQYCSTQSDWCWDADCQCQCSSGQGEPEDFYDSDCRGAGYTCLGSC